MSVAGKKHVSIFHRRNGGKSKPPVMPEYLQGLNNCDRRCGERR
jgi:hypothetical protein